MTVHVTLLRSSAPHWAWSMTPRDYNRNNNILAPLDIVNERQGTINVIIIIVVVIMLIVIITMLTRMTYYRVV
jgi:hypothetical protein